MTTKDTAADPSWEGDRAARWIRNAHRLGAQMIPISETLFAAAALEPGERVLDVGCGTGPTTRQAASEVGPSGSVVGLDLGAEMISAASAEPPPAGAAPIDWVVADGDAGPPPIDPVDIVISRFGVMFFADPPRAFGHLAAVTRPGGRLCVVTWAHRDRTEMFEVPLVVATEVMAEAGLTAKPPAVDAAAYSLGTREVVASTLAGSGWVDIDCTERRVSLRVGGGMAPAEAAEASLAIGPAQRVTADIDSAVRDTVVARLTDRYADFVDVDGHVVLDGVINVVTANRP